MAIKDLYKEVEDEKKNKVKKDEVSMSFKDFCEEHTCLIEVLREGSREELLAEAEEQEDELEEELKARGMTLSDLEDEEDDE